MKLAKFGTEKHLFLVLFGIVAFSALAMPSVLAEPGQIQIETTRINPEIFRDDLIIRPNQKICSSRSPKQCEEWLKKIRATQELRGIKIPQPQPDPFPGLIRTSPNPINPR
ncbi:hypothetical protein ACWATR_39220 [Nostoc sp. UIC 10890]